MPSELDQFIASFLESAPEKRAFDRVAIEEEIRHWFFGVYFNHWVEVGNGERDEGPEFVLQYWGTPMYVTGDDPELALWLKTDEEVVKFLSIQHQVLQESGYSHTHVPDQKVRAYNNLGGAIEVIWSRRGADETEIQRYVVHFEVAKLSGTWKVTGAHTRSTNIEKDGGTIDGAWSL
tara:strand:+ start:79 stop:609 length:531 start_codon:yes stop_codon:yes gene_type:complete